jgi:two-component system OmpR family sensor kinase
LGKGVARSIRLAQQLLEMARQEPENISYPFERLRLAGVIESVLEQARPFGLKKSVVLDTDIEDVMVEGNAAQLGIMIGNLVDNAILYTPEGGHVKISVRRQGGYIQLDISDSGIGIAPKDRERVFDRFYRVAGTGTTGSGLGLSIVKNIALLHGIEVEILEGLAGKGTTFRLVIPSLSQP